MHGYRKLLLGAAAAALAITALGAPAAAADTTGTLAIVNGIPGKKVDVCIAGKELSSGLAYGGVFRKNVISTGTKKLKFYQKDPRTCRGQLLGSRTLNISAGTDLTIAVTKNAPKVLVWDNFSPTFLGEIPPQGAPFPINVFIWRQASDMTVTFKYRVYGPEPEIPIGVTADPITPKGWEIFSGASPFSIIQLRATKPDDSATIAGRLIQMKESRRYEWVFIGTNKFNAKMVVIDRGISQPSV